MSRSALRVSLRIMLPGSRVGRCARRGADRVAHDCQRLVWGASWSHRLVSLFIFIVVWSL